MNKKILGTIAGTALAAVMLSSLVACGGGEQTPVGDVTVTEAPQESTSAQTVPQETQNNVVEATIEETVMWDNDHIKVTALNLTSDQTYHILNLEIENKTDSDLYVMASRTAVNSFVVEPTMGVDVPANSTVEGQFMVRKQSVAADVIADIETIFSYSSTDRSINSKTDRVKLETSAAATFDYSYDESGTILHHADGIKIICQGFNEEGDPMIYVSSTGELSEGCYVEVNEIYVNDKKTYSIYGAWIFTNTRNLSAMELREKDLDGNEIGKVESLKVSFKICKENVADSNPVKTELVKIPVE